MFSLGAFGLSFREATDANRLAMMFIKTGDSPTAWRGAPRGVSIFRPFSGRPASIIVSAASPIAWRRRDQCVCELAT